MTQDITETLQVRKANYGDFRDQAMLCQQLKAAMQKHPNYADLPPSMKESLEMIQHKISRIINGDPFYKDSWTDIIGYATIVERHL